GELLWWNSSPQPLVPELPQTLTTPQTFSPVFLPRQRCLLCPCLRTPVAPASEVNLVHHLANKGSSMPGGTRSMRCKRLKSGPKTLSQKPTSLGRPGNLPATQLLYNE